MEREDGRERRQAVVVSFRLEYAVFSTVVFLEVARHDSSTGHQSVAVYNKYNY